MLYLDRCEIDHVRISKIEMHRGTSLTCPNFLHQVFFKNQINLFDETVG